MKPKRKKLKTNRIIIALCILVAFTGYFILKTKGELQVITVVSTIDGYNYNLESNSTRLYKKYYKELEKELIDNKIDEKNYASLISKLFVVDYYTLSNKITNKDIGGVQFIHTDLQSKFISESSSSIYKYVKNNLYGKRKQRLPEVNDIEVTDIKSISYKKDNYIDKSGYEVNLNIGYVKKLDYPTKITLKIIHEDNKLSIIEIK